MKGKLNLNHAGHAGNHFAASFIGAAPWCGLVTEFALRVSASRFFSSTNRQAAKCAKA